MARFKQGDIVQHYGDNKLILEYYRDNLTEHPRYKYITLEDGNIESMLSYWIDLSGERVG